MIPRLLTTLASKAIGISVGYVLDRVLGEAEPFEPIDTRPCQRCLERDRQEREQRAREREVLRGVARLVSREIGGQRDTTTGGW